MSGYGATGPYKDYPSHGIAYDTWAGIVPPAVDDEGFTYIPEHVSIGIYAAVLQALGLLDGLGEIAGISRDSVGQALASADLPKRVRLKRTSGPPNHA